MQINNDEEFEAATARLDLIWAHHEPDMEHYEERVQLVVAISAYENEHYTPLPTPTPEEVVAFRAGAKE